METQSNSRRAAAVISALPGALATLGWAAWFQWRAAAEAVDPFLALNHWINCGFAALGVVAVAWLLATAIPAARLAQGRLNARQRRTLAAVTPRAWRSLVASATGAALVVAGAAGAAAAGPGWDGAGPGAPEPASAPPAASGSSAAESNTEEVASVDVAPGPLVTTPVVMDDAATPLGDATETPTAVESGDAHVGEPSGIRYTVRPGDSLWNIAKRQVGPEASDAEITTAWRTIYRANRRTIGSDPGLIYAGQRLTIPAGAAT